MDKDIVVFLTSLSLFQRIQQLEHQVFEPILGSRTRLTVVYHNIIDRSISSEISSPDSLEDQLQIKMLYINVFRLQVVRCQSNLTRKWGPTLYAHMMRNLEALRNTKTH